MKFFSRLRSPDQTGGELALPPRIRVVVGLGNPGPEYDKTRHNVGFELVDRIVSAKKLKWNRDPKLKSRFVADDSGIVYAKPQTFMNLSGNAVARLLRHYKASPEQLLVIYDEVALPIGRLRFRPGGSAAGHNGIKSIIEYLGTDAFPRLRIGIGQSGPQSLVDHVLGRFEAEEWAEMEKVLAIAQDGVHYALSAGLEAAMNAYNQK